MDKQGPAPKGKAPKGKGKATKPRKDSETEFGVRYENQGTADKVSHDYKVRIIGAGMALDAATIERGSFDTELGPIPCWNLLWGDGPRSKHKTLGAAKLAVAERLYGLMEDGLGLSKQAPGPALVGGK